MRTVLGDTLGLLDQLVAPSVKPRISFRGSLDYIDRLPSGRPFFTLKYGLLKSGRGLAVATNALGPGLAFGLSSLPRTQNVSKKSDFRLLGDGRTWHPEGKARPFFELWRGASKVVAETDRDRWERIHRGLDRPNPFSKPVQKRLESMAILKFSWPKRVVICLKRQIRREIMHALGVAGKSGLRPPLMRPESRIKC